MAVKSSGQISIQDIVNEFGGSAPDDLREYYRGGGFVPDILANNGIPTSGQINIRDFYNSRNVTDWNATVTVDINVDGDFNQTYGYSAFSGGSITDNTVNGATILYAFFFDFFSLIDWEFGLQGNQPRTSFYSMQPEGAVRFYEVDAVYEYDSGANITRWRWDTGSIPTQWDTQNDTPNLNIVY